MIFKRGDTVRIKPPRGMDPENNPIQGQVAKVAYINGEYHYVRLVKFPNIEMEMYRHEITLLLDIVY